MKEALSEERRTLLQSLTACLQRLYEWVLLADANVTPVLLQQKATQICHDYPEAVQCWEEENSATITLLRALMRRVAAPIAPVPQKTNARTSARSRFTSPFSAAEAQHQANLLSALADPTRLQILHLLSLHEGQISVFEIVEVLLPLSQPTISHHLRILREAGVVDSHKEQLYAYYSLRREELARIRDFLTPLLSR